MSHPSHLHVSLRLNCRIDDWRIIQSSSLRIFVRLLYALLLVVQKEMVILRCYSEALAVSSHSCSEVVIL